ncbi:MAG TPA: winged helix-turn-helix transcriptional regulator [Polyangiales bacterium]|nr:winged helix-turn-helix transcriptional regulator [Polyangiales bacterium]
MAKASEVLGERWMLLVLRELFAGATRYAELQRGLGRISPSVLSARIKTLIERGLVERIRAETGTGWQYRLTPSGDELRPVIEGIGAWGQRWVRSRMSNDELDVELLMLHLQRNFNCAAFGQDHAVVAIVFSDLQGELRRWWLLVDGDHVELCAQPSGRAEDVTMTCRLRTMSEIFIGDTTLQDAIAASRLVVKGPIKLTRNMRHWLQPSPLATIPAAARS